MQAQAPEWAPSKARSMRSERDIQRKPRRPSRSQTPAPGTPDAPGAPAAETPPAAAEPVVVNAAVKVSFAPPSEHSRPSSDFGRDFGRREAPRGMAADRRDRPPRQDARDPRADPRQNAPDRRGEPRREARWDARPDGRQEPRQAFRDDPRRGSRDAPRQNSQDRRQPARPDIRRDDRRAQGWPEAPAREERQAFVRSPRPASPDAARPPAAPTPRQAPADDGDRLSKLIAERGLASRREADEWIAAGWVRVDGQMAELGQRVAPDVRIEIDPAARQQQAQRVTILLHKPIGYVSGQAEDGYEPASVLVRPETHWGEDPSRKPFHPGHARGLAPAGRLDIDSTGLLVLTQDGRIAKALIGEDSTIEKEYLVRVLALDGSPPQLAAEGLALLNHGLSLDGQLLKPAKVSWANEDQLRFVLREGRKRQVRRMCELVGLKVVGLKRVRIGSVVLGKLPPGEWRYLREDERF